MTSALETALARHRAVTVSGLVLLTVIAWIWLFAGAGMEMRPLISLAPVQSESGPMSGMVSGPAMRWSPGYFALVLSMWWVMMVAMMLPSAAPMILLYARVARNGRDGVRVAAGSFLAGYLGAWGVFSLAATTGQFLLERTGLLAHMVMSSQSRWLSAGILVSAGIYQLSPLKDVCLRHCRSPAQFLSSHYHPDRTGALRMGLLHGSYCVGCCWLLMTLLFVGGVMNLAWIALLTIMVAAEKLLPFGRYVSVATGLACVAWGVTMLLA